MNHAFTPSQTNKSLCARCKRDFMAHTGMAECESCGKQTTCDLMPGNILACTECINKENETIDNAHSDYMLPENQQKRINEHNSEWTKRSLGHAEEIMKITLDAARDIDNSIEVKEHIFNAQTISIQKIKELIDADETIPNKDWELAKRIEERFKRFKQILFDNDAHRTVIASEMRASHHYLTELANRLTKEEREKLQVKDINYKPELQGKVLKEAVKSLKVKAKKLDMDDVKKYVAILHSEGIPIGVETLAGFCIARNMSPEQGHNELRKSIKEAKSQAS